MADDNGPKNRLSDDQLKAVIEALVARGVTSLCPMCDKHELYPVPVLTMMPVQDSIKGQILGGAAIPAVVRICNNCGYLATHALGTLDILDSLSATKGER